MAAVVTLGQDDSILHKMLALMWNISSFSHLGYMHNVFKKLNFLRN